MRWAVATILFIIAMFTFFVCYAASSLLLGEVYDALIPLANDDADEIIILLNSSFGIICAIFVTLIVFLYGIESLSDEPEYYWR